MLEIASLVDLSEISVDENTGIGSISRRALGRLCGVRYQSWGRGGYIFTKEIDAYIGKYGFRSDSQTHQKQDSETAKTLVPQGSSSDSRPIFDANGRVIDIVASLVVKWYSRHGKNPEQAQLVDEAFSGVGYRSYFQQLSGWSRSRYRPTRAEIIELCCLPVPTVWEQRFPPEYYDELSRLTGLKAQGHKRPALWAELTRELVYSYMPDGVYQTLAEARDREGPTDKLHQYLSDNGVVILKRHIVALTTLMRSSSSLAQLRELLYSLKNQTYQLRLI